MLITLAIILAALGGYAIGFAACKRWALRRARVEALEALATLLEIRK